VRSIGSSASAPPQVLIVDDHPPFRWIVRELLEVRGYAIAGEADCAASALAAAGARGFLLKSRLAVTDLARYRPPPEPTPP
jgi:CheY-like chemotaxis protein